MTVYQMFMILGGFTMMVWPLFPRNADGDVFFGISRALRKTYAVPPVGIPDDMMDNIIQLNSYERKRP